MSKVLLSLFAFFLAFNSNISFAVDAESEAETASKAAIEAKFVAAAKAKAEEEAALVATQKAACGSWNWGCNDSWNIALSVPAIKLRQGEKAKLFEGIAAGLQLNNLFGKTKGSLASGFILTPAFMLATKDTIDAAGSKNSDYVFSIAFLVGIKKDGGGSFQIGYGYDVMSSEDANIFKQAKKGSVLFNVGMAY